MSDAYYIPYMYVATRPTTLAPIRILHLEIDSDMTMQ